MKKKLTIKSSVICVLLVLSLVMFASCKKKVETDPNAGTETEETEAAVEPTEDDPADEDTPTDVDIETDTNEEEAIAKLKDDFVNVTIKFSYDSSAIVDSEITTLEGKAEWLRQNPDTTVTIEGHCDERGTTEYNLALGDRRAARVKNFLVNLGIDSERITTVSYGEEQPAVSGQTEAAWAKNRRAKCAID